jgi:hypothetical protein
MSRIVVVILAYHHHKLIDSTYTSVSIQQHYGPNAIDILSSRDNTCSIFSIKHNAIQSAPVRTLSLVHQPNMPPAGERPQRYTSKCSRKDTSSLHQLGHILSSLVV